MEAELCLALVLWSTREDKKLLELLRSSVQVTAESGENWGCSLPRASPMASSSQSPPPGFSFPRSDGVQAVCQLRGEQL